MPAFSKIMGRDKFYQMNRFIHFNNNLNIGNSNDKLYKIIPVIEYMNLKWNEYSPPNISMEYTIDETMVPYRGRLGIKQFIPINL